MSNRSLFTIAGSTILLWLVMTVPVTAQPVGGVSIDPQGILRHATVTDHPSAAAASPQAERLSKLRKVSLKRLEARVRQLRESGKPLPGDLQYLAGLERIDFVLFYPASGDVVLAGPAQGWTRLRSGEVVANRSRRPVLELDDLVVALRYAFAEEREHAFIGCSIDPTAQGNKRYARFISSLSGQRIIPARIPQLKRGMADAMGMQQIRVFGIAPSSRFAAKMVAADYRLKRLAMGHDSMPIKGLSSYLGLLSRSRTSSVRQQHRWWFVGRLDAIHRLPDRHGFELVGSALEVATAPQAATRADDEVDLAKSSPAARQFANSITRRLPQLAKQVPVFADLDNLVRLAVAAELIASAVRGDGPDSNPARPSQPDAASAACWRPGYFLGKSCPVATYEVPRQVPCLATVRGLRNRRWLLSVSGGVELDPTRLATIAKQNPKDDRRYATLHDRARPAGERFWRD